MANKAKNKKCSKCLLVKDSTMFGVQKRARDGLFPWCLICKKNYDLTFYAQKKQSIREAQKKYREKNKEELLAKSRMSGLAWRKKNRAKDCQRVAKYRSAKRASSSKNLCEFSQFAISEIYDVAQRRSRATGVIFHVDHVVPLQGETVCGLHIPSNLAVITARQNWSKNNKVWPDMWESC